MMNKTLLAGAMATVMGLSVSGQATANDWQFGIGTGLRSLALEGDIGFTGENGGLVTDVDLDNGDTADMFESAFGFAAFARKDNWTIHFGYATLTLEDDNQQFDAEWDKVQYHFDVEYHFATTGNSRWGALVGVRGIDHEWEFQDKNTGVKSEPEDDWIDAVVGLTHTLPFNQSWAWANRVEYGFGDSEGTFYASTGINWMGLESWVFNLGISYADIEYGDEDDINDNDFYYYDVEETTIGLGFMYTF